MSPVIKNINGSRIRKPVNILRVRLGWPFLYGSAYARDSIDQQVFRIPMKGGDTLRPDIRDIGYYTWITDEELGMFRIEGEHNN
jgi:hypothetical protein